jgi:hypothetical protein
MDFGIARGEDARLTQTGQIFGTPSYTAPEALGGTEPSGVSDRYAFAVTAFQMLTGELPFECPTIAGTLFRIAHEPPLYPDSMSPPVREVFEKALAKHPGDRYPDLASFIRDLIAALDLPAEAKAKFLGGMAGAAGAEVTHRIMASAEATATFNREYPTQATPARPFPGGTDELATEAFRTPKPGTILIPGNRTEPTQVTAQVPLPEQTAQVPAPPARRLGWPSWLAAALLLAVGILGGGAAWEVHTRPFHMDILSTPPGASIFLDGKEIGRTDLVRAEIPRAGGTLRLELDGYDPLELKIHKGDGPVRAVLTRPPFTVRVVTYPPGAEAFLNGVAQGVTPISQLQVPGTGRQELVLRLRDRQDWSQVLDPDLPLPAIISLEPRPAGARIRTNASIPPAAAPAPEGRPAATATPGPRVELPPVRKTETAPAPKVEVRTPGRQQPTPPAPLAEEHKH